MFWRIDQFPICTHHVFLSHCREDRDWLVVPLYERLQSQGIIPWLDRHDYPWGRTSFEALRMGLLKSRHAVFFVTEAMLNQPRGWSVVELVLADLLQENLDEPGLSLQNVARPLFFLDRGHPMMLQSAWLPLADRAAFHRPSDGDATDWAVKQVATYFEREALHGREMQLLLSRDKAIQRRLSARPGLIDRITARHPAPAIA